MWFYITVHWWLSFFVFVFWNNHKVVCFLRWHGWCHMKLLPSRRVPMCTPYITMHHANITATLMYILVSPDWTALLTGKRNGWCHSILRSARHSTSRSTGRGSRFTISTTFMATCSTPPKRPSTWEPRSQTTLVWIHTLPAGNTTNKASKTLEFLRRNLKACGTLCIKEKAHKALVMPVVEFTSPVWDLYTAKNINKLDAVPRRAARWMVNCHQQTSAVSGTGSL